MSIQGAVNSLIGTVSNVKMTKDLADQVSNKLQPGIQGQLPGQQPVADGNKSDLASQEAYKHMMEKVLIYNQYGEVIR